MIWHKILHKKRLTRKLITLVIICHIFPSLFVVSTKLRNGTIET